MSYTPYVFPDFPNVESRQQTLPLRDGKLIAVQSYVPTANVSQNANPNAYAPSNQGTPPGTQPFGLGKGYEEFPQNLDIIHREIRIKIDAPLLYRSMPSVGRVASRDVRIHSVSVTTPATAATFSNGVRKGDVYGA